MPETVKIRISIHINTESEHDTELTVKQWNALTDDERATIRKNVWDVEASNADSGGIQVITDGAEDV